MKEVWKNIVGYDNYQISNYGNIKRFLYGEEIQINKTLNKNNGYYYVSLSKNSKGKSFSLHQLVAIEFLNHTPCGMKLVVNHIDTNKLNNRVDNLEIISQRENANLKHIKSSSKYVGVCWNKRANKWVSQIIINGKIKYLGYFHNEIDASNAYQNELKQL